MKKKQKAPKLKKQSKSSIVSKFVMTLAITLAIFISLTLKDKPKAVIIDQLGTTYPNPSLVRSVTEIFTRAGFEVDYIPAAEVTVDFYRNLPVKEYKYIILRAHSCLFLDDPDPAFRDELTFSTTELYTKSKYVNEQITGEVAWLGFNYANDETKYFGVSSRFVDSSIEGNFNNATMIIMGCNGLTFPRMAKALLRKGVHSVIGWDKSVSLNHTDTAVEVLVENLLGRQMKVKEAVENTMSRIGQDPEYGSKLLVYQ